MKNNQKNYDDILYLPHPTSPKRPRMAIIDRAAQFSPFAALTGYEEAVEETARLTEDFIELDESQKAELDEKLRKIQEEKTPPEVTITYFSPDEKKAGGTYLTITGKIKKIDTYDGCVVMEDGNRVRIEMIVGMEIGREF